MAIKKDADQGCRSAAYCKIKPRQHWGNCCSANFPVLLLTQGFCRHNPLHPGGKPERLKEPPRIWFGPDAAISGSHGDSGLGICRNLYRFWAVCCWRQVLCLILHTVLSMTHFIWMWSRRKCIHNAAWTENSLATYFHLQRRQIPHTLELKSVWLQITPASVERCKNCFLSLVYLHM